MKLKLTAFLLGIMVICGDCAAQNVPQYAIPIGRGPGVTGFNSAAPAAYSILGNPTPGTSVNPVFTNAPILGGALTVNDTTDSSSTSTGSIHTAGGIGLAKALTVGTNVTVGGAGSPAVTVTSAATTGQFASILAGQGANYGGIQWLANTTGASATLQMVTSGYTNPITIDGLSLVLQSNSLGATYLGGFTEVRKNSVSALTLRDATSSGDPFTMGASTTGGREGAAPGAQMVFTPAAANANNQLTMAGLDSRVVLVASNSKVTPVFSPQIILTDTGVYGTPVSAGGNQAGIGLVGYAYPSGVGTDPFNINFVNLGPLSGTDSGSANSLAVNMWSTSTNSDAQSGYFIYQGCGGSTWASALGSCLAGARLGQISGVPTIPGGPYNHGEPQFVQSESWSMNGYTDVATACYANTTGANYPAYNAASPIPGSPCGVDNFGAAANYDARSNIIFRIVYTAYTTEQNVGGFYNPGTWALGAWANSGNGFSAGPGSITFKDSCSGAAAITGGTVACTTGGQLKLWSATVGSGAFVLTQGSVVTVGHHACWSANGILIDCGS